MVELTKEEEEILDGSLGEALAEAMKVVVKVGEALEAEKLVPISHAHVSGISYKNIGEAGLDFLSSLAEMGAKVMVPSTINPAVMDVEKWREMGVTENVAEKQRAILNALKSMGFKLTLTCTPYLYERVKRGSQVAWAESNAVLYGNSVCGLMTNREGGPLALMEALVGRAPYTGYRLKERRKPDFVLDVCSIRDKIRDKFLYPALGYYLGLSASEYTPAIRGLRPEDLTNEKLKAMLAAAGASGSLTFVHIEGLAPQVPAESVQVERPNISDLLSCLPAPFSDEGDVLMGCPHLSPSELAWLAEIVSKYGKPKRRVIVFSARQSLRYASHAIRLLRSMGIEVYFDTCMVVADLHAMGVSECTVDSAKAAYYLASQGYDVRLFSRRDIRRVLYG